jgi:hypothetical protein
VLLPARLKPLAGTLDIFAQPTSAEADDGQRWATSEGHFMQCQPEHRIEVKKSGYRQFTTEIEVGDGQTVPLNVSLMTTSS